MLGARGVCSTLLLGACQGEQAAWPDVRGTPERSCGSTQRGLLCTGGDAGEACGHPAESLHLSPHPLPGAGRQGSLLVTRACQTSRPALPPCPASTQECPEESRWAWRHVTGAGYGRGVENRGMDAWVMGLQFWGRRGCSEDIEAEP